MPFLAVAGDCAGDLSTAVPVTLKHHAAQININHLQA